MTSKPRRPSFYLKTPNNMFLSKSRNGPHLEKAYSPRVGGTAVTITVSKPGQWQIQDEKMPYGSREPSGYRLHLHQQTSATAYSTDWLPDWLAGTWVKVSLQTARTVTADVQGSHSFIASSNKKYIFKLMFVFPIGKFSLIYFDFLSLVSRLSNKNA